MKFEISPNKTKTEEQFFKKADLKLNIEHIKSNIKGLTIWLNDGLRTTCIPASIVKNLDISKFSSVWFEYISADKKYIIKLIIN